MINLEVKDQSFRNSIYSLIGAFYPHRQVKIIKAPLPSLNFSEKKELGPGQKNPGELEDLAIDTLEKEFVIYLGFSLGNYYLIRQEQDKKNIESYKTSLHQILYKQLSKLTGKTLAWGVLTGIRPSKIAINKLINGDSEEEITSYMKDKYLCSTGKIKKIINIAKREIELLNEVDYKNGYSLYIGIPFCPSTCLYCSFTSYSIEKYSHRVESYLKALEKEIIYISKTMKDKKLTTIYFGGGTPTTLDAKDLDWLISTVKKHFNTQYVKEFSVEAGRPDSLNAEKLRVLKNHGVSRISINPQSMKQKTLDLIGRNHSVEDIIEKFHLARSIGFDNINMDIIIGLPGEDINDVTHTLEEIKKLDPDSITVHALALKRAARLNLQKNRYKEMQAQDVEEMFEISKKFCQENNYIPYYLYRQKNIVENLENVGYARYGKEGLYNILIMEEKQSIIALGAGGMSKMLTYNQDNAMKDEIIKIDNVRSVDDYIDRIDEMIERKREFFQTRFQ